MGRLDKLIEALLRDDPPREMAYRDIAKVLGAYGWTEREGVGSHLRWEKVDHDPITVSLHGNRRSANVDRPIIQDVIDAITDRRRIASPNN